MHYFLCFSQLGLKGLELLLMLCIYEWWGMLAQKYCLPCKDHIQDHSCSPHLPEIPKEIPNDIWQSELLKPVSRRGWNHYIENEKLCINWKNSKASHYLMYSRLEESSLRPYPQISHFLYERMEELLFHMPHTYTHFSNSKKGQIWKRSSQPMNSNKTKLKSI